MNREFKSFKNILPSQKKGKERSNNKETFQKFKLYFHNKNFAHTIFWLDEINS